MDFCVIETPKLYNVEVTKRFIRDVNIINKKYFTYCARDSD